MKKKKVLSLISILSLLLCPVVVFASSNDTSMPIVMAIIMEAFVTIHMSIFVLLPLSKIFSKDDSKKLFWKFFVARIFILLFFDLFITTSIAFLDFMAVFIGAFILMPISTSVTKKESSFYPTGNNIETSSINSPSDGNEFKCAKCGDVLKETYKFCCNCGEAVDRNNVVVTPNSNIVGTNQTQKIIKGSDFDSIYNLSENNMLNEFIDRELEKCGIDKNVSLIPSDVLKKKKVFNLIFLFLVFIYISLIFFHFPIYTYIIGFILLFIFYKITKRYSLIKYLKKEIKSRPSEKISNIVMNTKSTFVSDDSKKIFAPGFLLVVILPLIIFINPRIMYEKTNNGYAVRFYTFGLTNFTTAQIPETYKNKPVVSLRGNTFSNMFFLKKVTLPNTITEIRGQAFKNNRNLTEVNIPNKLEYLGGGAFYNCSNLVSITLPDTLTYMGGETFSGASSLKEVKLSNNLKEIRGNSFENCTSLTEITIPDTVTRIGGHAFYGNISLSKVTLTENSKLKEIGSSAFRQCSKLEEITLPSEVYVNERAFKESPTIKKYFGLETTDYTSSTNESIYNHKAFKYLKLNKPENLPGYVSESKLTLTSIEINKSNGNRFYFEYTDGVETINFSLEKEQPTKEINQNLVVEIAHQYVYQYRDAVSLNVYYN